MMLFLEREKKDVLFQGKFGEKVLKRWYSSMLIPP
jgi:hypothetical protein